MAWGNRTKYDNSMKKTTFPAPLKKVPWRHGGRSCGLINMGMDIHSHGKVHTCWTYGCMGV